MGLGQFNSLGEYCGPHTASSVFLILIVVCGISSTSCQLITELFPHCLKVMLFALYFTPGVRTVANTGFREVGREGGLGNSLTVKYLKCGTFCL